MFTNKELLCLWLVGLCIGFWTSWMLLSCTLDMQVLVIGYGFVLIGWSGMIGAMTLSEYSRRKTDANI